MLSQTIDQLLPVLDLMQQPAFCISANGVVYPNRAARHIAPSHADSFPAWLGDSADSFQQRDPAGHLEIPVHAAGEDYLVTIQDLQDGLLCLLRPSALSAAGSSAMAVASQVLRQPLTDLSSHIQRLSDLDSGSVLPDRIAAMQRQLHRISRIAANLTDIELLQQNKYPMRIQRLDAAVLFSDLLDEVSLLAKACDHPLNWNISEQSVFLQADRTLLKRAVLNLISNALKFSTACTPVSVLVNTSADRLLIKVANHCDEDASVVLRGAFDRLQQRDLLPDPRWGVGLGLPLVQAIAQAHGGMVALEYRNDTVTVTMSVSRRRSSESVTLQAPDFLYDGGLSQPLLELSDCLPNRFYHPDAL